MKAFYDSEWRSEGSIREVHNPFDESVIDTVSEPGLHVLDQVLTGLSKGVEEMANLDRQGHHRIFIRLREIMIREKASLVRMIQVEQGKPWREASLEFEGTIQSIEALADNPSLIGSEIEPLSKEPGSRGWQGFTLRQPHGIVGILTPLTYPLLFPAIHSCFALAAGNAILLKPARSTPLITLRLTEMLLEAGLPPSAIACVPGSGKILGKAICADVRLNHLACLGRLPTIKSIRNTVAFIPTNLQWGCVSTVIADRSTNVSQLIKSFMRASFENAGQSAFTPSWIGAVDEVHDEILDCLAAAIAGIKLGDPLEPTTQMGPVASSVSKKIFDTVLAHELSTGAEVVAGGSRVGRLIQPTLLRNCDLEKSSLTQKEITGPLVGISRISSKEKVIDTLRKQRYHILTLFTEEVGMNVAGAMKLPFQNIHLNGIPTWRDGLICVPGHPPRSGLRDSYARVKDYCRLRDVVYHPDA